MSLITDRQILSSPNLIVDIEKRIINAKVGYIFQNNTGHVLPNICTIFGCFSTIACWADYKFGHPVCISCFRLRQLGYLLGVDCNE